jgi:hypothetical protein
VLYAIGAAPPTRAGASWAAVTIALTLVVFVLVVWLNRRAARALQAEIDALRHG